MDFEVMRDNLKSGLIKVAGTFHVPSATIDSRAAESDSPAERRMRLRHVERAYYFFSSAGIARL